VSEEPDARYEWAECPQFGSSEPLHIRVGCKHLTPVTVNAANVDEPVALLCPDCDTQLPTAYTMAALDSWQDPQARLPGTPFAEGVRRGLRGEANRCH